MNTKKKSAKKKLPTKKTLSKSAKINSVKKKELKKIKQPKKIVLDEPPSNKALSKTPKPKIKRYEVFENAIKVYMNNSNVAIIKNGNGTLTIVTKKVLGENDSIASFNPATIELMKRGKIKVGILKLRISMDGLSAILMAFTKMLKSGMLVEEKEVKLEKI